MLVVVIVITYAIRLLDCDCNCKITNPHKGFVVNYKINTVKKQQLTINNYKKLPKYAIPRSMI
jgi:hypothetical protein